MCKCGCVLFLGASQSPPPSISHEIICYFPWLFPHPHFFTISLKLGGEVRMQIPPFFGFPQNSNLKPATIFQKMGEELKERLSKLIKLSITPPSPPPHSPSENFLDWVAHAQNVTSHKMLRHTHTHQRPRGSWWRDGEAGGTAMISTHRVEL